ncbi:MAG: PhoPQ-activated protein PqaA family protein [Pirellulaceae bacterium]
MRSTYFAFLALIFWITSLQTQADDSTNGLQEMVMRRDNAYHWEIRHRGDLAGCAYLQLHFVSQRWQGLPWKHMLVVIRPPEMKASTKHALMLIDGGSWNAAWGEEGPGPVAMPDVANLLAMIARETGTPVAIIRQIPFQPMMGGLKEDALIAATLKKYFETGDANWPLLPVMVRSASAAIDATVEVAKQEWGAELDSFTVTGASKRGWTTYLLGATDSRVKAIAPMVIDMLNMKPQMQHQIDAWGAYSRQIDDYTKLGLQKALGTPQGDALNVLIDPYAHRARLTVPKLVILGTNDPYWPVDSTRFYFDELPEPCSLLNIPNNGHGLNDISRMIGSVTALHHSVIEGTQLPKLQSNVKRSDSAVTLDARSDRKPARVYGWVAKSPIRDFRGAKWNATSLQADTEGHWKLDLTQADDGFVAGMIEAQYDGKGTFPLSITTQVHVAPDFRQDSK